MKRSSAGSTLIDCMVAVAVLGIGVNTIGSAMYQYQHASERAFRLEGAARVLDNEMERLRSCEDRSCVEKLETATATTALVTDEANTWVRARVKRVVANGPEGTLRVTLSTDIDGLPEQQLTGLIWVKR